jgi:hypothetical protein
MASKVRYTLSIAGCPYMGAKAVAIARTLYVDYRSQLMPEAVKKLPRWKRVAWIAEHTTYPYPVELKIWREPRHANPKTSPYVRELCQLGFRKAKDKRNGRGARNTIR